MTMNKNEILEKCKYYCDWKQDYSYIVSIFNFDKETIAPRGANEESDKALARIQQDIFKVLKSDDYINYVKEAYEKRNEFDEAHRRLFEFQYKEYIRNINISPELQYENSLLLGKSYSDWLNAKEKGDYNLYEPTFRKVVEMSRKLIELRDNKFATYYDMLLDDFEPGNNEVILDKFFSELKEGILPIIKKINASKQPRKDFLSYEVPIPLQERMSEFLLKFNGFDTNCGVLSTTEHPFTDFPSEHDIRVTTHYYLDMFTSNIYSVIHEGGHAIFGQNIPHELFALGLGDFITSAEHETISRFYENYIGRNKNYVYHLYNKTNEICGDIFKDVSFDEFYKGINIAEPSLIRTESDELTYCIHILIRYELEKDLINGKISTQGLNLEWNRKYKEYLGVEPKNDSEGILQDVHWTGAAFGYFPSYALGNAYGAMILNKMKEDIDFDKALLDGDLEKIKNWLKDKVFSIAPLKDPNEWIKAITGKDFSTKDYINYLHEKFSKLYKF